MVIGDNVVIGNFTTLEKNVRIGNSCKIGHHNSIMTDAKIKDNVIIENNCVLYKVSIGENTHIRSFVELRNRTIMGTNCYVDSFVKSSGENIIGNNVTLRYSSIIARGCDIGDNCYICPQVMTNNVDHNGNEIGGAHIKNNCFIGTQTVLGAGLKIVEDVVVGSCSYVSRSIEEKGIYIGVPAKQMKKS